MLSRSSSVLLKVGGIGFCLGFASWAAWAVLAALSFGDLLPRDGLSWMSGIFFQAAIPALIFYGLLSLSLLFGAVGCFTLFKEHTSWLELASGVTFIVTFGVAIVYLLPFVAIRSAYSGPYAVYFIGALRLFPLLFFSGLILWGATLLVIGRKMGVLGLSRAAGSVFIASGVLGMLLWQVILYWGFEFWILLLGWLYAAGALITALIFFRISRIRQSLR